MQKNLADTGAEPAEHRRSEDTGRDQMPHLHSIQTVTEDKAVIRVKKMLPGANIIQGLKRDVDWFWRQGGFEVREIPPASASKVPGLKMFAATDSLLFFIKASISMQNVKVTSRETVK